MWCTNCRKELQEGSMFCCACGAAQKSLGEDKTVTVYQTCEFIKKQEKISFVEAVKSFFANYFNFRGRTSKREYWLCFLFIFIIYMVSSFLPYIGGIIGLALCIPNIALNVRRLHDTGKSWLYLLISFIPIVGVIILIIQYCKVSDGDNQWGPRPLK